MTTPDRALGHEISDEAIIEYLDHMAAGRVPAGNMSYWFQIAANRIANLAASLHACDDLDDDLPIDMTGTIEYAADDYDPSMPGTVREVCGTEHEHNHPCDRAAGHRGRHRCYWTKCGHTWETVSTPHPSAEFVGD